MEECCIVHDTSLFNVGGLSGAGGFIDAGLDVDVVQGRGIQLDILFNTNVVFWCKQL